MSKESAPLLGYIEGYFGRLLDWPQRHWLMRQMADLGLDTWVYAPKEDPLHRRQWRQPYPAAWREEFAAFCQEASSRNVHVVAALSPGLDFDFADPQERQLLYDKYRQLLAAGAHQLALLFDDIPLPPENADAHIARQQAELAQDTARQLDLPAGQLWFCPTQYCSEHCPTGAGKSTYLAELAETLPADTPVFWTGPKVISPRLRPEDTADITALFGKRTVLWDNCYANDWAPRRLILNPYRDRPATRLLLNPTGLPHTDALYLELLARHTNEEEAESAFLATLDRRGVPATFHQLTNLFTLETAQLPADNWQTLYDLLSDLAFGDWCSELKLEWYPFVQGLRQDVHLIMAASPGKLPSTDLNRLPQPLRNLIDHASPDGKAT